MRLWRARADSAAFCLPRQPAKPGDGKLAAEPSAEELRVEGEAWGPLCGALPEGSTQSERAARLVLLVEASAAAPPDGPFASHRLWVTDTHSEGEEGTSRGRGWREETGQSHSGRRCRGAEWSLGNCSSPTEEKRDTLLRMRPLALHCACLGGEARPPPSTVTMVTDTLRKRTCSVPSAD